MRSDNLSTEDNRTPHRALVARLERFWQEGTAAVVLVCAVLAAGAYSAYSGMPMVCH